MALLTQHYGRPRPSGVEVGRQVRRDLARHPANLLAAAPRINGDCVRVVLVRRIAPKLERAAGPDILRLDRLGVMLPSAGDAGDAQASRGKLGRVATEIPIGRTVEELVAHQPDLPAVVGVPVPLLPHDFDLDRDGLHPEGSR